ncbi:MAG TPA: NADH-quinone oxidoreductase subunit D [Candidatus Nitrosotenuis sp.]|jgi:NADH-quinone oxidoreductase subunit D|nr:NADH-quinone oxidoreductase subunit D [Candidatus Nitrosotenuis sp.]
MLRTEEFEVNMGPQHPSTHGVLRMVLKMDGERVVGCEPVVGYLHRSIEKMAENRTFTQVIPVTDRLDYCTSMTSNYVYVLAVEKLADLTVPPRGEYIRVIMTELNRIASHLLWFGTFALEIGATTPFLYAFRDREKVLDLFEMTCGARLLYNYIRIGGVAVDLPAKFLDEMIAFLDYWEPLIPEYEALLDDNPIFYNRTKGVGVLSPEMALRYGISGPNLRASGLKVDVRKDEPFSVYGELLKEGVFDIPTGQYGDVFDRYRVRMQEMRESSKILRACAQRIPAGPYRIPLPYRLTVPEGEAYGRIESPRGDIGCHLVSRGGDKPYRCKFRGPSFTHIQVFRELVKDVLVPDIMAICASFDIVLPETDR